MLYDDLDYQRPEYDEERFAYQEWFEDYGLRWNRRVSERESHRRELPANQGGTTSSSLAGSARSSRSETRQEAA